MWVLWPALECDQLNRGLWLPSNRAQDVRGQVDNHRAERGIREMPANVSPERMVLLLVLGLVLSLATAQFNLQTAVRRNYNLARVGRAF